MTGVLMRKKSPGGGGLVKIRVKTEADVRARQPQAEGSLGFQKLEEEERVLL